MSHSEEFDDPEPFESSGDDWKEDEEKGGKKKNARISARVAAKPRKKWTEADEEEDEEEDYQPKKKKQKNGGTKKGGKKAAAAKKEESEEDEEELDEEEEEEGEGSDGSSSSSGNGKKSGVPTPKEYMAGQFVLKRKDVGSKDKSEKPNIWRIDGKQLLQRYDPFEEDGEVRHKNTQVYSGWSIHEKEQYIPLKVNIINREVNNTTVSVKWDEIPKDIKPEEEEDE